MVAIIRELRIPFLGGSSLTHVGLVPALPMLCEVRDKTLFSLYPRGAESYGFHSIMNRIPFWKGTSEPDQISYFCEAAIRRMVKEEKKTFLRCIQVTT